jgi:hypothetical protein
MKLKFFLHIFEKIFEQNFVILQQVGAELFYAGGQRDRQTDRYDEANNIFFFCICVNARNNDSKPK